MAKKSLKEDKKKTKAEEAQKPISKKAVVESKKKKKEKKEKKRVPWRVDLKWIFGLLATLLITAGLTTFAFYRIATNPAVDKYVKENLKTENNSSGMPMNLDFDESSSGSDKMSSGKNKSPNFKMKLGGKTYDEEELEKMDDKKLKELIEKEIEAGNLTQKDFEMLMAPRDLSATTKKSKEADSSEPNSASESNRKEAEGHEEPGDDFGQQIIQAMMIQAIAPLVTDLLGFVKRTMLLVSLMTILVGLLFMALTVVFSSRWGRIFSFAVILLLSSLPIFITSMTLKSAGSVETALKGKDSFSLYNAIANANFSLFSVLVTFTLFLIVFSFVASLISRILKSRAQPKAPKQ
ncbi:MAG: hypothetical protein E3J54_05985, partial [Actinobacteria bacterium]